MDGVIGRQHEDRFREVEFVGDALHQGRIDGPRIGKDGKRVAAEDAVGEHVGGEEPVLHEWPRWISSSVLESGAIGSRVRSRQVLRSSVRN